MLAKLTCLLLVAGAVTAQNQFRERSIGANTVTWDAAFVDIDHDGDEDLLQTATHLVTLKRNDGSGRFSDESIPIQAAGLPTLQIGDFDGDGDADAFVLSATIQGSVLLRNNGAVIGAEVQSLPAVTGPVHAAATADFDGDNDLDIAVAPSNGSPIMLRNDGTGSFVADATVFAGISLQFVATLATGDFDGNGATDLFVMAFLSTHILLNNGTGTFSETAASLPQLPIAQSAAVADFDGDGTSDVFVALQATSSGGSVVLRGDGQGGLTQLGSVPFGGSFRLVAVDLDEDGDVDVAGTASNLSTTTLAIYLNDGQGNFTDATAARANVVPDRLARIAAGDPDGDGDLDLFVGGFVLPVAFPQHLFVNHHRQAAFENQPVLGGNLEIELNYLPGYGTGLGIGLSAVGFAAATTTPTPFGRIWLDSTFVVNLPFVSFPGANGTAQLHVAIPDDPALTNAELLIQALPFDLFDPTAPRRLTGFDRVVILQP